MKVLVVDGQGGKMGAAIVEGIKRFSKDNNANFEIIAAGTNSIATSVMLKAGADCGATGENPVVVLSKDSDVIVGPMGIIMADALMGEITSKMACAISQSKAEKVLIPMSRCHAAVVGARDLSINEYVDLAIKKICSLL